MTRGIRWFFKAFLRRPKNEPSYCLNCHSFSFEEWYKHNHLRAPRWDCTECDWTHAFTLGGKWRATPPKDSDEDQGIISR